MQASFNSLTILREPASEGPALLRLPPTSKEAYRTLFARFGKHFYDRAGTRGAQTPSGGVEKVCVVCEVRSLIVNNEATQNYLPFSVDYDSHRHTIKVDVPHDKLALFSIAAFFEIKCVILPYANYCNGAVWGHVTDISLPDSVSENTDPSAWDATTMSDVLQQLSMTMMYSTPNATSDDVALATLQASNSEFNDLIKWCGSWGSKLRKTLGKAGCTELHERLKPEVPKIISKIVELVEYRSGSALTIQIWANIENYAFLYAALGNDESIFHRFTPSDAVYNSDAIEKLEGEDLLKTLCGIVNGLHQTVNGTPFLLSEDFVRDNLELDDDLEIVVAMLDCIGELLDKGPAVPDVAAEGDWEPNDQSIMGQALIRLSEMGVIEAKEVNGTDHWHVMAYWGPMFEVIEYINNNERVVLRWFGTPGELHATYKAEGIEHGVLRVLPRHFVSRYNEFEGGVVYNSREYHTVCDEVNVIRVAFGDQFYPWELLDIIKSMPDSIPIELCVLKGALGNRMDGCFLSLVPHMNKHNQVLYAKCASIKETIRMAAPGEPWAVLTAGISSPRRNVTSSGIHIIQMPTCPKDGGYNSVNFKHLYEEYWTHVRSTPNAHRSVVVGMTDDMCDEFRGVCHEVRAESYSASEVRSGIHKYPRAAGAKGYDKVDHGRRSSVCVTTQRDTRQLIYDVTRFRYASKPEGGSKAVLGKHLHSMDRRKATMRDGQSLMHAGYRVVGHRLPEELSVDDSLLLQWVSLRSVEIEMHLAN